MGLRRQFALLCLGLLGGQVSQWSASSLALAANPAPSYGLRATLIGQHDGKASFLIAEPEAVNPSPLVSVMQIDLSTGAIASKFKLPASAQNDLYEIIQLRSGNFLLATRVSTETGDERHAELVLLNPDGNEIERFTLSQDTFDFNKPVELPNGMIAVYTYPGMNHARPVVTFWDPAQLEPTYEVRLAEDLCSPPLPVGNREVLVMGCEGKVYKIRSNGTAKAVNDLGAPIHDASVLGDGTVAARTPNKYDSESSLFFLDSKGAMLRTHTFPPSETLYVSNTLDSKWLLETRFRDREAQGQDPIVVHDLFNAQGEIIRHLELSTDGSIFPYLIVGEPGAFGAFVHKDTFVIYRPDGSESAPIAVHSDIASCHGSGPEVVPCGVASVLQLGNGKLLFIYSDGSEAVRP